MAPELDHLWDFLIYRGINGTSLSIHFSSWLLGITPRSVACDSARRIFLYDKPLDGMVFLDSFSSSVIYSFCGLAPTFCHLCFVIIIKVEGIGLDAFNLGLPKIESMSGIIGFFFTQPACKEGLFSKSPNHCKPKYSSLPFLSQQYLTSWQSQISLFLK